MRNVWLVFGISIPAVIISFIASAFLHQAIYERPAASSFAKLRGGPAIGVVLILANSVIKRAVIRQFIEKNEPATPTLLDVFALMWGAAEIASGTFLADLWRSIRQKDG